MIYTGTGKVRWNMKKILCLLLLILPIVACSQKDQSKPLVTIDGYTITLQEFNSELDKIPVNMKMMVATQNGKKSFLDRLIVKKLLLKEAAKENLEKSKEFQDRLGDIKEQLLIESLLKKKLMTDSKLTDEELNKYYEGHKDEFKKPPEMDTSQIVVKTEKEAKEIQAKLTAGEDFPELARKYSLDPAAKASGGRVGYQPKGSLIPEYEAAASKLTKPGQVSPSIKTQLGYHIIRLEGIKPPQQVPFAEVKDFIKQKLAQERQQEVLEKYIESLRQANKITINEELLKEEGKKPEGAAKTEQQKTDSSAKSEQPASSEPKKEEAPPKK
jgi:peptidyl-prolyl cis-trans isomerase C